MFGYKYIAVDDEQKHIMRTELKIMNIIHKLASCYEWGIEGCEMPPTIAETLLCIHGMIGTKDAVNIGWVVPSGQFGKNGLPTKYNLCYLDGTQETDLDPSEIIVCFNGYRPVKSDIALIEKYGEMLANIDLSEVCNIIYSRNLPIPIVDDDIDKAQIEHVILNAIKGKISIVSKSIISKFKRGENDKPVDLLPIFNVNSSENLQDLSRFCEEIEKRLFAERGIDIATIDKKAQISEDELNNMSEYSQLSIKDLTECRKDFCKRVNEKFGTNWTCKHITEVWVKKQKKEKEEMLTEGGTDENDDDVTNREDNDATIRNDESLHKDVDVS